MLSPKTQLGPYEITGPLGSGGMGEVYKARDTRLGRSVAIKVLGAGQLGDPRARERFEREARAVSSLNHPHICALYDIGEHEGLAYLVLEYLEGAPPRGPMAVEKAIELGMQIADALDAAHRAGVTHRDLKPGNILITKTGAKLLDFGLARISEQKADIDDGTKTANLTLKEAIIGTPAYMAPEQVQGRLADARTDIFATGLVLHEMVTGQRVVGGETTADMMASVIRDEPAALKPHALDRLVRKCLEKDPDKRWQSAADLCDALGWVAQDLAAPTVERRSTEPWKWALAGFFTLVLAGALLFWHSGPLSNKNPVRKFTITDTSLNWPAISPEGSHIAYINQRANQSELVVYDLRQGERRVLASGAPDLLRMPFWSPDEKHVGYVDNKSLLETSIAGGSPSLICNLPGATNASYFGGASYAPNGTAVVFSSGNPARMYMVSGRGGTPKPLLDPKLTAGEEIFYSMPHFLRGNMQIILFTKMEAAADIVALDLRTRHMETVTAGIGVSDSPTGHLLFNRNGGLWAMAGGGNSWKTTGEPFLVAQNGDVASVGSDGTLVYLRQGEGLERLIWKNRQGIKTGEFGQVQPSMQSPRLSPDGTQALVVSTENGKNDIWIHSSAGGKTRLTSDQDVGGRAAWSPNGQMVSFSSTRAGNMDIYLQKADASLPAARLLTSPGRNYGYDWSPDGKILAGTVSKAGTGANVYYFRQKTSGDWEAVPFVETPFDEYSAMFSPDGKYLAYTSNETGRHEVYVRQFPEGGKWQVSANGGTSPYWRHDGKEFFYAEGDNLMAVTTTLTPAFTSGVPRKLFEHKGLNRGRGHQYDVSHDGQTFLVVDVVKEPERVIQVVENWFAEFSEHGLGK